MVGFYNTRGHVHFGHRRISDTYHDIVAVNENEQNSCFMHAEAMRLYTAVEGPGVHAWCGS